jgi:hypothetical protein
MNPIGFVLGELSPPFERYRLFSLGFCSLQAWKLQAGMGYNLYIAFIVDGTSEHSITIVHGAVAQSIFMIPRLVFETEELLTRGLAEDQIG